MLQNAPKMVPNGLLWSKKLCHALKGSKGSQMLQNSPIIKILNIIFVIKITNIMNILNKMNITAWMAMAGAVSALVSSLSATCA